MDRMKQILRIRGAMRETTRGTGFSPQVEYYKVGDVFKCKILLVGKVVAETILDPKESWQGTNTAIGIMTKGLLVRVGEANHDQCQR